MRYARTATLTVKADHPQEAELCFASLNGAVVGEVLVDVNDMEPIDQQEEE